VFTTQLGSLYSSSISKRTANQCSSRSLEQAVLSSDFARTQSRVQLHQRCGRTIVANANPGVRNRGNKTEFAGCPEAVCTAKTNVRAREHPGFVNG
jgi:hypothetical protein